MKRVLLWVSILLVGTPLLAQVHFSPVSSTGLPYAVVVQNATWDDDALTLGDEVGVFDGELCVGAGVFHGSWPLSITAWQADQGQGLAGFTTGHQMSFVIWQNGTNAEALAVATYLTGDGTFGYGFGTNISLLAAESITPPTIDFYSRTLDFEEVEVHGSSITSLEIYNVGGQNLTISGMEISDDAFETAVQFPITLLPGQANYVTVYFQSNRFGQYDVTLTVFSNDPNEPEAEITLLAYTPVPDAHFESVEATGLPYALVVQAAEQNGSPLMLADEIAVFDGDLCVGTAMLHGSWPVSITLWQGDASQGLAGFTPGNQMVYRVYSYLMEAEMPATAEYLTGDGTFGFGFGTNLSMLSAYTPLPQPIIHLPEDNYEFGEVFLGEEAEWQVTIQNLGLETLNITQVSSTEPQFSTSGPMTVPPESDGVLTVTFEPTVAGPASALITLLCNDPQNPEVEIQVFGSGVLPPAPDIEVDESMHDFGEVQVGQSAQWTAHVTNAGNAMLVVSAIESSHGDFSSSGPFNLAPDAGAANVVITFTPSSIGGVEGIITLISNDPDEGEYEIHVFGEGFPPPAPEIYLPDTVYDFGDCQVGDLSSWEMEIVNQGNATLTVSSVASDDAAFVVDTTFPLSIGPGSSDWVWVQFAPSQPGPAQGTLTVTSNDPNDPVLTVTMEGTGLPVPQPEIRIDDTSHDFGTVIIGESRLWVVEIFNDGNADLSINTVVSNHPAFPIPMDSVITIEPFEMDAVVIRFTPSEPGLAEGIITFSSNDPVHPTLTIDVSGTGELPPEHHFDPVAPTFVSYPIQIEDASIDGSTLAPGDEIGVFDGELCVGMAVVGMEWPLELLAWQQELFLGMPGYEPGNEMSFRLWSSAEGAEYDALPTYTAGDGTFGHGTGAVVFELQAVMQVPDIVVSWTTHDFGELLVGFEATCEITISNEGSAVLNLLDGGVNHEAFSVDQPDQLTLEPGGFVSTLVRYHPMTAGLHEGVITIFSNDPDESELELTVSGTGVAPSQHFTPVDATPISTSIVIQMATLDEEPLVAWDEIAVYDGDLCVGASVLDGDWAAVLVAWRADMGDPTTGYTPGNPMLFRVWSNGRSIEAVATAEFETGDGFFSGDPGPLVVITLLTAESGGETPDIQLAEDFHDFGDVVLGEESVWHTLVHNLGDAELVISQMISSDASFTTSGPLSIPPGGEEEIWIGFSPTELGAVAGTVTLVSNDPDEGEVSYSLVGNCVAPAFPDIHIEESEYDFGNVLVGEVGTWLMRVENLGDGTLTITSVSPEIADSFSVEFEEPVTVEPAGFVEISVNFIPTAPTEVSDYLLVVSDDPDEAELQIVLRGRGVTLPGEFSLAAPEPDSLITSLPLTFHWHPAENLDLEDVIGYQLLIAPDLEFTVADTHLAWEDTLFVLENLPDDTTLFWRVRAVDTNSDSCRYSNETWRFVVSLPDPPAVFDLLLPVDSTYVDVDTARVIEFVWHASIDPDPGAELLYRFSAQVTYLDLIDTTLTLTDWADTSLTLNLVDSLLLSGWTDTLRVWWWVDAISQGDTTECSARHHLFFMPWLSVPEYGALPLEYGIRALYPNPFNPTATLVMGLPVAAELRVEMFNLLGQRVALLANGYREAGYHRFVVDGHHLASGVYFVRATSPGRAVETRKVVLMR